MAMIDIRAYRDQALDQTALQVVSSILDFFQRYEKDLILRFVYDCEGDGLLHEPAVFSVIEEHIRQLAPVIHAYTKTIFVLQGLFVGSWGEMHGSKFLSPICLKKLYDLVKTAAGPYTWLAVRKPAQWRSLHSSNQKPEQMGLFNDGILGSETNLGTYGYLQRSQAQWDDSWCPQDERAFEEQLCRTVPHGGEAVYSQTAYNPADAEILQIFQNMHITYLNCAHDLKLLEEWKQKKSPWPNVSLFDYIGAHLGFRFCVRMVRLQKKNRQLWMEITIENTGFAPCYEEYAASLKIMGTDNMICQEIPWDFRTLMPCMPEKWTCILPNEKGELYLHVHRKKDGRILHFANAEQEDGDLLLGWIK